MTEPIVYTYTTQFEFPYSVNGDKPFSQEYSINSNCSYSVSCNGEDRNSVFFLSANACATDPMSHIADETREHATELKYLYNILQLAIAFMTGHIVRSDSSVHSASPMSAYYELPRVSHDYFERAKEKGLQFKTMRGHETFTSTASIFHPFNPQRLDKLASIVVSVKQDTTSAKFLALKQFLLGFLSHDDPFSHWHHIVETVLNKNLGFIDARADEITLDGMTIDVKFLRDYAHLYRHSRFNLRYEEDRKTTLSNPGWSEYISNPRRGSSYYRKMIETILEHFLLQC